MEQININSIQKVYHVTKKEGDYVLTIKVKNKHNIFRRLLYKFLGLNFSKDDFYTEYKIVHFFGDRFFFIEKENLVSFLKERHMYLDEKDNDIYYEPYLLIKFGERDYDRYYIEENPKLLEEIQKLKDNNILIEVKSEC